MFIENIDDLPEVLKADFIESERDGKKGYQHKDTVALSNALASQKTKLDELRGKLTEFEAEKSKEIEAARLKALEEARNNKDVDAIEKRYQEQMADLEKRTAERVRGEVLKEVSAQRAAEKADVISSEISAEFAVNASATKMLKMFVSRLVKVGEDDGKDFYLDENGGATSLSRAGFIDELYKNPEVNFLLKNRVPTTGGGAANGGGLPANHAGKWSDYTEQQLAKIFTENPALFKQIQQTRGT